MEIKGKNSIGVGTCCISQKAKKYVNQVLDSERLSYGPFVKKFESVFASSHMCRFGIMTNSGTSSLEVSLAALKVKYDWKDGDEVLIPAVTFVATANIVIMNNMIPILVDVEPKFYGINHKKIEDKITKKSRCIIPVHLFGCPCDMDPIIEIAKKYNLRIIEDSCETMFVKYRGRSVGSFGDIGCFSTYTAHIITTGIGGLCTTNDPDLAVTLRSMINHGRDSIYISIDDDKGKSDEEKELIIRRRFKFTQMGYSYRVSELEGALGLAEYENHEKMMQNRYETGRFFIQNLRKYSDRIQLPMIRDESGHSFMMFPIVMRNEKKSNIVSFLEKHRIETRDMLPLTNQPFYKDVMQVKEDNYPVAKWINESGFYIASHHGLSKFEKEYILEVFSSFFEKRNISLGNATLVVLSKTTGPVDELSIDLFIDSLPLGLFDEYYLVESSDNLYLKKHFENKGFTIMPLSSGKGTAIKKIVDQTKNEKVVVMGIDGSDNPDTINEILLNLRHSEIVVASRFLPGAKRNRDKFLKYRSFGNRFFNFLLDIIFNKNITDCNNTFRGFKKLSFKRLDVQDDGDNFMFEMSLKALENKLIYLEIPTIEKRSYIRAVRRRSFLNAFHFLMILMKYLFAKNTLRKRKNVS